MKNFIKQNKIRIKECIAVNENKNAHDWKDADHYKVVLAIGSGQATRQMTTYFSKGYGHNGKEPVVEEILDCLASDAHGVRESTFEEWADDLGYDTDSKKIESVYKACKKIYKKLEKFIGDSEKFKILLYDTQRL